MNKLTEKNAGNRQNKNRYSKRDLYNIGYINQKKNTELLDVVAHISEIKNFIQSESLLSKLEKRIDQQKKQDSRPIAEY